MSLQAKTPARTQYKYENVPTNALRCETGGHWGEGPTSLHREREREREGEGERGRERERGGGEKQVPQEDLG